MFPGEEEEECLGSNSIFQLKFIHNQFDETLYPPYVINRLKISDFPKHKLIIKADILVMFLININQKNDLCNETRRQIVSLDNHVIEWS